MRLPWSFGSVVVLAAARLAAAGDILESAPSWIGEGDQETARYGDRVACAGDVNGDGFADVIVGAASFDHGEEDEGRVFVYHGSPSGPTGPVWSAEGDQAGAWFGASVAGAGDVNADGFSDVIVGAPEFDAPYSSEGAAFVYHGSVAGLSASPSWAAYGKLGAAAAPPRYRTGRGVRAAAATRPSWTCSPTARSRGECSTCK